MIWRTDIENMPRDGSAVVIRADGEPVLVHWYNGRWHEAFQHGFEDAEGYDAWLEIPKD